MTEIVFLLALAAAVAAKLAARLAVASAPPHLLPPMPREV
jgi:hypothetical protein